MATHIELQQEVLALTPEERERIALVAWQSLDSDLPLGIDSEGIDIANTRDAEIESGLVQPISHEEFMRRTSASE